MSCGWGFLIRKLFKRIYVIKIYKMGITGAKGILINSEKKFLLHLRDDKPTIPFPNYWSLLGGGVEKGETVIEAFRREIKEEIDYDLNSPIIPLGRFESSLGGMVYVYKSKIEKKLGELTLYEGQELGFFTFEEAIELKIPLVLKEFLIKNQDKILSEF